MPLIDILWDNIRGCFFGESLGEKTTYTSVKSGTHTMTGFSYSKKMPLSPMCGFKDEEQERLFREYCRCAKLHDDAENAYLNY